MKYLIFQVLIVSIQSLNRVIKNNFFEQIVEYFEPNDKLLKLIKLDKIFKSKPDYHKKITSCYKGDPDYFKLVSTPKGKIGIKGQPSTIILSNQSDDCWQNVNVQYLETKDSVTLEFKATKSSSLFCSDTYMVGFGYNIGFITIQSVFGWTGKHSKVFSNLSQEDFQLIQSTGVVIQRQCDDLVNTMRDIQMTVDLFKGGLSDNPNNISIFSSHTTKQQEVANLEFVQHLTGYQIPERKPDFNDLQDDEVNDGDHLAILRLDGLDPLISIGTGGRNGHSTVIIKDEKGVAWVYESQDAWYWPLGKGWQKNKWSEWKKAAKNASYNVILLPLNQEKRDLFIKNKQQVLQWFEKHQGTPYGFRNFLQSWIDTEDKNLPQIFNIDVAFIYFSYIEHIHPEIIQRILGDALNMRLKTTNLTLPEIQIEAAKRNITIAQLLAIPEQDDWQYKDGLARTCASFVVDVYKQAGLFGELKINASEFTPRDLYQLNFFDKNQKTPQICKDQVSYCQIMGDYLVNVDNDKYSTIEPYEHMFEKCPSIAPDFDRSIASVLKWDPESPYFLAQAYELGFVAWYQRHFYKEALMFGVRTTCARVNKGEKKIITMEDAKGVCYICVDQTGACAAIVTDEDYPKRVAFQVLAEIFREFYAQNTNIILALSTVQKDTDFKFTKIESIIKNYQNADKLTQVQKNLDDVTEILRRGEKLEDLMVKSKDMNNISVDFYRNAKKTNKRCCTIL